MSPRSLPACLITLCSLLLLGVACGDEKTRRPESTGVASGGGPGPAATVEPGLRVAFVGDQGSGKGSREVLELIPDEGADFLILLGDFDYEDDPEGWDAQLRDVLGDGFPVFGVIGNHDEDEWPEYSRRLESRLQDIDGASCSGEYGINALCHYRGLAFILSGAGTKGSDHEDFIRDALGSDNTTWRVCAWHKNQERMQVESKGNSVGWGPYEACREAGAFIVNGHAHVYSRTKTLSELEQPTIDRQFPEGEHLRVGGGSTFVAVSGLGGRGIRPQGRCYPANPPYGCGLEWASIYTETQGASFGAMFIDFGVDGDPNFARGYFKNVDGRVVDSFDIVRTP